MSTAAFKNFDKHNEINTDYLVRENELRRKIEQEVNNLPPKMKTIFELSRKHYLTHQQIADEIGVPEGTVRNIMTRTLQVLRSKLTCFFLLQIMYAILWLYKSR
jgi:RNA polymerase sigma factor (sigma-70 family)